MEHPTDSSRLQLDPGNVFKLNNSIYGLKQAGNIWGSVLHDYLNSIYDKRIYFFKQGYSFITISIVVDEIAVASNDTELLKRFKITMAMKFDLSLFG